MQDSTYKAQRTAWWDTSIIDMRPGIIRFRGYSVEDLIGNVSFPQMIWLMLRGELPTPGQAGLLDAVLTASVDHGPQAPSIAIARMAATCGVGLNNAMASAVNVLGDIHGGAGEQAVTLFHDIQKIVESGENLRCAAETGLKLHSAAHGKYIPGYGHRFHPVDPRAPRLIQLVREASEKEIVSGCYMRIALEIEAILSDTKQPNRVPMNIDGASAVIYAELGFEPPLARGLFCLSRAVGILAHSWEEKCSGSRNKGPIPRTELPSYSGPSKRSVPIDT